MEDRQQIWNSLVSINQEIILAIYGSKEEFIGTGEISPIEKYLIAFDQVMDDEGAVRTLAFRIGADVPYDQDAAVFLYWIFRQVALNFDRYGNPKNPKIPSLSTIIDGQKDNSRLITYLELAKL